MNDDSTNFDHAGLWIGGALAYMAMCVAFPLIAFAVGGLALICFVAMSSAIVSDLIRELFHKNR